MRKVIFSHSGPLAYRFYLPPSRIVESVLFSAEYFLRSSNSFQLQNTELGESRKSMLVGTMVHTLFQMAVTNRGQMAFEELREAAKRELAKLPIMQDMYVST